MAGKPAAVVINTAGIIVLNAGNLKKESRGKDHFPEIKNARRKNIFFFKKNFLEFYY